MSGETSASAASETATAIEVDRIGRRNPKSDGWLIHDVSLTVAFGDRLGLVGPSGAGKTVLLRALAALDPLDAGSIRWRGHVVRGDAVPAFRNQVIYLHQRPALFAGSVLDNLRAPFLLGAHCARGFDRERVVDLLASLGRPDTFLSKSSRDLSGGERQIAALVRALQLEPAVLLLDEPAASLDPDSAAALEQLLERWLAARAGERALVWAGHDRDQTRRMTARRINLCSGRLEAET
jgi:putative ABC transport system ATP-binding protein